MSYDTLDSPLSAELLTSRFDNAKLVRVDPQSRLIAVWNGSETINLYTFTLDEVQEGPHNVPRDDDGNTAPMEEVDQFIDELFEEYEEGL